MSCLSDVMTFFTNYVGSSSQPLNSQDVERIFGNISSVTSPGPDTSSSQERFIPRTGSSSLIGNEAKPGECSGSHSFIHSGYFYSASPSPLLLRGAPDTARILCRSFTPKRHRQLRVKDLPKVPTWTLEWEPFLACIEHL